MKTIFQENAGWFISVPPEQLQVLWQEQGQAAEGGAGAAGRKNEFPDIGRVGADDVGEQVGGPPRSWPTPTMPGGR